MARADWSLEWEGLDLAQRGVVLLAAAFLDLRPFWPRVSRLAIRWLGEQFETEGELLSGGTRWAALSPGYLAWKSRNYPGKGILSATGALRRAATTPTRIVTPTSLTLRIEPYSTRGPDGRTETIDPDWFQSGTNRMPARPLIYDDLPDLLQAELDLEATDYADGVARTLGL